MIAAGLLGAAVSTAPKEKKDVWFSGLVEEEHLQSLKQMAIDQKPILFPGVLIGWDNYDEAYRYVNSLEYHGEGDPYRVIFFASEAQSLKFINTRYFSHRLAGYIYA